ncbi:uncharacterized protein LOC116610601 [Nematostella vectensis]|uniref:uncharacterized protein LOC116610601 n=1 Tax=Nematostella vectensis TaxID=45351 RepID=UPI00207715E2|nr:uncharacterized protein LOC116610601 [Nematostella vectensis]
MVNYLRACDQNSVPVSTPSKGRLIMSFAPDLLDAERENYLRLAQLLVEGGTSALRKQFEDGLVTLYPGATLGGVLAAKKGQLQQLKTKGKLNQTQWRMLYPASGDPNMNNFDITSLSVLLRNIGSSRRPTDPFWNNDPPDTDTSKEANYVRLRLLRNEIGHSPNITIKEGEFETYWRRISNVLISLGGNKGEIDHLKTKPLATKDYVGVLQQWMASDFVIFEELQEIRKENKQRDEETKQRDDEMKKIMMKIGVLIKCPLFLHLFYFVLFFSACQLNIHIDCKTQPPSPPSSLSSQASNDEVMQTIVDYFFRKLNRDCQRLVLTELTARYNAEYVTSEETNSLSITISCQSLEGLQKLWDDSQTGRLNEEMEKLLVVDEVLQLYNLKEIKLQTKIVPEDFVNCWNQMKSDPDTPSADEHDQEVEQELMRRIREAEDAAQREKEKRKVIEAALAQMIQENTSKFVDKLKKKELTESEREELLQLLVAHHKVLLENVSCFEDSLRDKELGFLKNIVHDLNNSVMNVKEGKEELAKLIPKYHEIMIRNIEQDPKSEKSYQALRDTTHDLLDGLRDSFKAQIEHTKLIPKYHEIMIKNIEQDPKSEKSYQALRETTHDLLDGLRDSFKAQIEHTKLIPKYHEIMIKNIEQDPKSEKSYQALRDTTHDLLDALRDIFQAQTEHTKLIPKYHEIMIKNIEQDPKSEKSYQALRDTTHDLLDALRDIYQAQTEHAKLIPKYHEIMIKNIEQDPKSEKSYQALRDTTHDLARFCKGKEELDEIFLKYHTFLLKNIEQEPMSERSHNALIAATHDLSEFSSCVTDEGKQQLSKLLPQYYTILLRKIEQDPMSKSSLDALITATDDLSKMWHSSEIGKQEITKLIPKHNENILKITERVMNESGSADSGLDRLERVISILTSLVKPTSQDNRKILDLIVKMADEISQDTESVKGLDRIQKTVEDLGRFLQPSDAGQKQLFKLTDELCNTLIHRVKLSDDLEPLIRRVEALSKNLSGPSSDRVVISLLSVIEAALRLTKEDPHPHLFDSLERLCCIVIDEMEVTHLDGEELSRILTSLYKCFAALAESPRYSIKVQWMIKKQMMALEEMIKRHPKSGKEVTKTIPFSSSDIGGLGLGSEKGKWQVVQEQKKKDTSEFPESHLETRKDTELK